MQDYGYSETSAVIGALTDGELLSAVQNIRERGFTADFTVVGASSCGYGSPYGST